MCIAGYKAITKCFFTLATSKINLKNFQSVFIITMMIEDILVKQTVNTTKT